MSEEPVERLGPCQEGAGASVLLWLCRPLGLQAWPSCLEWGPGGRAEAAKARPKPQAWHAHTHKLAQASRGTLPVPPPRRALCEGSTQWGCNGVQFHRS